MRLEANNVTARVVDANDGERAWLYDYCAFSDKEAFYKGTPGAKFRLFDLRTSTFPSGLVWMVLREHARLGALPVHDPRDPWTTQPAWWDQPIELVDLRAQPVKPNRDADLGWLKDWADGYQYDCVRVVWDHPRGVINLPTASGKTEIAIGLAVSIPCHWLFVVHRSQLMHQAAERWERRHNGKIAGRIGDGFWVEGKRFTTATFDTLYQYLHGKGGEILRRAEAILVDEVHTGAADTRFTVLQSAKNAYYRIGLSATPFQRGDEKNMVTAAAIGRTIFRVKPARLIAAGVMSTPRIRMIHFKQDIPKEVTACPHCEGSGEHGDKGKCPWCSGRGERRGVAWQTIMKLGVTQCGKRNEILARVAESAARPCMLFIEHIVQGRELTELLEQRGITCVFAHGARSTKQRRRAVEKLIAGDLEVLVTSKIMQEGLDIPSLNSVINGAGLRSVIATLQKLGRGSRVTKEKKAFELWDIFDEGHRWLRRHSRDRKRAYELEGYDVEEISVDVLNAMPKVARSSKEPLTEA